MSEAKTRSHSIGAEIPYRRDRIEKTTGSLVFDRHLDAKLAEGSPVEAPEDADEDGLETPVPPGQVT